MLNLKNFYFVDDELYYEGYNMYTIKQDGKNYTLIFQKMEYDGIFVETYVCSSLQTAISQIELLENQIDC